MTIHKPVLLNEVINVLNPQPGEFFIDGTFGGGGHGIAILEQIGFNGSFLGIDWNKDAIEKGKFQISNFKFQNALLIQDNFANLPEILEKNNLGKADGLLLDLGTSSDELENSGRGFSFRKNEPLLMTYNDNEIPVRDLLKQLSKEELTEIIKNYGGENWAIKIAEAIKDRMRKSVSRRIETSRELAELISETLPKNYEHGRIHPATRTFMALRIYANRELENLEKVLKNLDKILKNKGRIAIISFHSLEDRLVKNYFKKLEVITKKPIIASREEILKNPRSRSAKLRAAILTL
ncbi:MAG: 16S rRNA (cytosine(1402)-N(4))-methyltransferase RsmH [Patescibacteria group bacterium]